MNDQRPDSPIVERGSRSNWKFALVALAAAFAFWQLREMTAPTATVRQPAQSQMARAAPMERARPTETAAAPQRVDPRAPAGTRSGEVVQQTVLAVVGQPFDSLAALDSALAERQFARVGRFGEAWPATAIQARTGFESVELEHAGQAHRYTGFTNADLLALALTSDEGEPVSVVYRRLR